MLLNKCPFVGPGTVETSPASIAGAAALQRRVPLLFSAPMQSPVIAFLAGMGVMYLWQAIRWRRVRKWLHGRWETFLHNYHKRMKRSRRRSKSA
jgi:hypothetical protein